MFKIPITKSQINFLYLTLFYLALSIKPYAQSSNVDKLTTQLYEYKNTDSNKVKLFVQLAQAYYTTNPTKMKAAADSGLQIAKAIRYYKGIGECERLAGISSFVQGDFAKAKQSFDAALASYKLAKYMKGVINSLSNLGSVANVQNNYTEALDLYQQSVKEAEKEKDYLLMGINYGNIGIIYSEIESFEDAKTYFQRGIQAHEKVKYTVGIATGLGNIGNILFKQKYFDLALKYYDSALQKHIQLNSKFDIAREKGNCANALLELNKLPDAYKNLQEAFEINKTLKNKKGLAVNNLGFANYYKIKKSTIESMVAAKDALYLADEIKINDVQYESCKLLSELFEANNKDSAYFYYKKYVEIKNTIDNELSRKKIVRMGLQYDFDVKEQKYIAEKNLNTSLLQQQNLQLALNTVKLSESAKQQEIQKIEALKKEAELENEQLQNKNKDNEMLVLRNEKNIQEQKTTIALEQQKLVKVKLQRTILFALLSLLGLASIAIISIYYLRTKTLKTKNELAIQQLNHLQQRLDLQNEIKLAEMAALRSQMNPHFIFNALNAINNFVLNKNTALASNYIYIFSKLMRNVLNNSQYNTIALSKELEVLELYLQLEQARMNNKFGYKITFDEKVDLDFIQLPPLLLQPFVENAIWHGIQPKEKNGFVNVCVMPAKNDGITIKITDDGIGRKASMELKGTNSNHESKGIDITTGRVIAMNQNNKIEYEDLVNDTGISVGTSVNIYLY